MQNIPVFIVGAGPSGLTMATCLQRHGIAFRIIDKNIKPVSTSNALAMHARTLEMLDDLGLADTAIARGVKLREFNIFHHNKKLAALNMDSLESHYKFTLGLPQSDTEKLLLENLQQKNITVEMEVELIDIQAQEKNTLVTLRHKNGKLETLQTDWLIACDGSRSIIREKMQLSFRGQELAQHFVLADLPTNAQTPEHALTAFLTDNGPLLLIRYNKEYLRVIAEVSHDPALHAAKLLTAEQLKHIFAKDCPIPLQTDNAIWTSGFWIHERLISAYAKNRVFFVGDAAHTHSPAGGQGMNTGMQDAYNLSWKLALVIQEHINPSLLNSYQAERRPIAKKILASTTGLTRMVTLHNPLLKAIRNFIIYHVMKSAAIRKKLATIIAELNIDYKNSPLTKDCYKKQPGPKPGTRMLDVQLNATRLFDKVRGTEFCLLIFSGNDNTADPAIITQLKAAMQQQYPKLIKYILISPNLEKYPDWDKEKITDNALLIHHCYQVKAPMLYLIRPDKYIGFRGDLTQQNELLHYFDNFQ